MTEVSLLRLYILRATYVLVALGLILQIWPLVLAEPQNAEHFRGVTWCLLTGVSMLALLGIRYPLKMLPLLFFELIWKLVWVLAIGLPLLRSGQLTGAFSETWFSTIMGLVVFPLAIPWGYVVAKFVRESGDRWTTG